VDLKDDIFQVGAILSFLGYVFLLYGEVASSGQAVQNLVFQFAVVTLIR
jgi:hypothetical protein